MTGQPDDRVGNVVETNTGNVVQANTVYGDITFPGVPPEPLAQRGFTAEPRLREGCSPSALLRGDYKVVPFHGRGQELSDLTEWCVSEDDLGVRLCTGPGGQGKTRLALEVITELSARGWTAGRLRPGCDEQTLRELCHLPADTLLVLDYAETQPELLATLFELAGARPADMGRLRLLLLARSATEWWPQRRSSVREDRLAALMDEAEYPLSALFDQPAGRPGLFADAVAAFGAGGGYRTEGLVPPEDLADDRFASALALHMTALAMLLDHQEGADLKPAYRDPAARVLDHEQRYWTATARAIALPYEQARTLRTVITTVTTCGASDRDEAGTLMGRIPDLEGEHPRVLGRYADWAHQLYPGENWLNPLAPDLLGERLVADTLTDQPELAAVLGGAAETPAQQASLCTVLGRAAVHHESVRPAIPRILAEGPDTLWLTAAMMASYLPRPDLLVAALIDSVDGVADPSFLWGAVRNMPHSHRNCELKITAAERALRRFGEAPERDVPAEAELNALLADGLTSANRFEESLAPYREAISLYRRLMREQPERYRDEYLRALANHAVQLDNCAQPDEALQACRDVLAEAERYGRSDDRYLRSQVWWCRALVRQHRNQRGKAAREMATAVAECREAAQADQYAAGQLPLMIMNLANRYSDLGQHEAALPTIEESVALLRERDRAQPDPLNPSLGQVLINHSQCLYALGRPEEGRAVMVEAVHRLLRVTEHHSPCLPLLWSALRLWGARLNDCAFTDVVRGEYDELATLHLRADWPRNGLRATIAAVAMIDYSLKLAETGDAAAGDRWRQTAFELFPHDAKALWAVAVRGSTKVR
jgi:tetratricopeptide (TPR) repeat protein